MAMGCTRTSFLMFFVIRWISVICQFDEISNFEVQIFVIVYFQLRKREFDWSKIFFWPIRDLFSVKKNQNKYSYFKIRNFVKLANHQMTYIQNLYQKISFKCIVYNKYLVYIAYKVLRKSSSRRLSQHQIPSYKTFVMIKFWARPCLYQTISTIYKSDFWLETFTDEI